MDLSTSLDKENLGDMHEFVEESFYSLVEETSKLSALIYSHPDTDYEPEMETADLEYTTADKKELENRIEHKNRDARDALQEMDAALLFFEEKVEDVSGIMKDCLLEEKIWYRDKYLELEEEIAKAESKSLLEEKTDISNYDRPDFDLDAEIKAQGSQVEKADSRY